MKERFKKIYRWEHFWLCLLLVITLALHFSIIMQPDAPVFDEQHYITDGRSIIEGKDSQRPEHPDLAKLLIVAGMRLFDDNPFGWRFFSVLFGAIVIVLFYFICRRLNMDRRATLLATFLLSFENLTFIQGSIAMLDVFNVAFMLGAFLLYLRGGYVLSGVSAGLSTLCKIGGILAVPAVFLHWLFTRQSRGWHFLAGIIMAPLFFFLFLPVFSYAANGTLPDPIARIQYILSASGSLTFEAYSNTGIASRPWEWVMIPEVLFYWYEPHYLGAISFTIWALIIPAVLYMFYRARKGNNAAIFGLAWFTSTYLFWIPLSLVTDRLTYLYYFYPTVGALCIGLGLAGSHLMDIAKSNKPVRQRRTALITVRTYLVLHIVTFIILSPLFSRWVPFFKYVPPPSTTS